jgi:hypothetical protein
MWPFVVREVNLLLKKEEKNGTHIAKMHVGLANATTQTRGGRGEQRRTRGKGVVVDQ